MTRSDSGSSGRGTGRTRKRGSSAASGFAPIELAPVGPAGFRVPDKRPTTPVAELAASPNDEQQQQQQRVEPSPVPATAVVMEEDEDEADDALLDAHLAGLDDLQSQSQPDAGLALNREDSGSAAVLARLDSLDAAFASTQGPAPDSTSPDAPSRVASRSVIAELSDMSSVPARQLFASQLSQQLTQGPAPPPASTNAPRKPPPAPRHRDSAGEGIARQLTMSSQLSQVLASTQGPAPEPASTDAPRPPTRTTAFTTSHGARRVLVGDSSQVSRIDFDMSNNSQLDREFATQPDSVPARQLFASQLSQQLTQGPAPPPASTNAPRKPPPAPRHRDSACEGIARQLTMSSQLSQVLASTQGPAPEPASTDAPRPPTRTTAVTTSHGARRVLVGDLSQVSRIDFDMSNNSQLDREFATQPSTQGPPPEPAATTAPRPVRRSARVNGDAAAVARRLQLSSQVTPLDNGDDDAVLAGDLPQDAEQLEALQTVLLQRLAQVRSQLQNHQQHGKKKQLSDPMAKTQDSDDGERDDRNDRDDRDDRDDPVLEAELAGLEDSEAVIASPAVAGGRRKRRRCTDDEDPSGETPARKAMRHSNSAGDDVTPLLRRRTAVDSGADDEDDVVMDTPVAAMTRASAMQLASQQSPSPSRAAAMCSSSPATSAGGACAPVGAAAAAAASPMSVTGVVIVDTPEKEAKPTKQALAQQESADFRLAVAAGEPGTVSDGDDNDDDSTGQAMQQDVDDNEATRAITDQTGAVTPGMICGSDDDDRMCVDAGGGEEEEEEEEEEVPGKSDDDKENTCPAISVDALSVLVGCYSTGQVEKWSSARLSAWASRRACYNKFLYRFPLPGTVIKQGAWAPDEVSRLVAALLVFDQHCWPLTWGFVAFSVRTRCGYTCRSQFHKLISSRDARLRRADADGLLCDYDASIDGSGATGSMHQVEVHFAPLLAAAWACSDVQAAEKLINDLALSKHPAHASMLQRSMTLKPAPLGSAVRAHTVQAGKAGGSGSGRDDAVEQKRLMAKVKAFQFMASLRHRKAGVGTAASQASPPRMALYPPSSSSGSGSSSSGSHAADDDDFVPGSLVQRYRRGSRNASIDDSDVDATVSVDDLLEESVRASDDDDDDSDAALSQLNPPNPNLKQLRLAPSRTPTRIGKQRARTTVPVGTPSSTSEPRKRQALLASFWAPHGPAAPTTDAAAVQQASTAPRMPAAASIVCTRIPKPPIPRPWAHRIAPFVPPDVAAEPIPGSVRISVPDLINECDWGRLSDDYIAVLADPPWRRRDTVCEGDQYAQLRVDMDDVARIPFEKLIKVGIVFIWSEKDRIQELFAMMRRKGFFYVENISWVRLGVDNRILVDDARLLRRSKQTLFMFRLGKDAKDGLELRHQRSPDVIMDFVSSKGLADDKPDRVYTTIETMLPQGEFDLVKGQPRFLELWARPQQQRHGWACVSQLLPQPVANADGGEAVANDTEEDPYATQAYATPATNDCTGTQYDFLFG